MKKLSLTLTAAVLASTLATGCAPLLIGGAMMGGVSVATDRRTSATQLEDETIELKAGARIREQLGDRVHVNVNSYNRVALITGEANSEEAKASLESIVGGIENVQKVLNTWLTLKPIKNIITICLRCITIYNRQRIL